MPNKQNYAFLTHALKAEQAHSILVPEMRPQLWQYELVARAITLDMSSTLISDRSWEPCLPKAKFKLCLFYDGLSEQGPRGICGSLLAVHLARHHNVPIELLASEALDGAGADRDVSTFLGQKICPAGFPCIRSRAKFYLGDIQKCKQCFLMMTRTEREMIQWGKLLFERRLISGWGGNLSCRIGKEEFLITGQHAPLGLRSSILYELIMMGKPSKQTQRASSETPLHLAVYRGTDAEAIVHVHPPMVLAFSQTHESFIPISFEEKYTIGEVPIIPQDTPTVTKSEQVVEELKYHPVVIIKGHGTVAIGKNFQDAFLFTDLLEEAVYCQFFKEGARVPRAVETVPENATNGKATFVAEGEPHALFSQEHMTELVECANHDSEFRQHGSETSLSTSHAASRGNRRVLDRDIRRR